MSIKVTNTLLCDDVRQENNGKYLVIGLYTGPIGVPQIPIPLVLTFMHFLEGDRLGHFSLKFRIEHLESGRRLIEGAAQLQVNMPGVPIIAPVKVPLQIDKEGSYNMILEIEGEREPVITQFAIQIVRPAMQMGMPPMMPR